MMLSGNAIAANVAAGYIVIDDFDPKKVNPNSYNLRLHDEIVCYATQPLRRDVATKINEQDMLWFGNRVELSPGWDFHKDSIIDMARDNPTYSFKIPPEGAVLVPGRLYLARTMEYTETHRHAPMCEGRSSIGRLGICVHVTAGFGDVGFCGHWTLEIAVVQPVRIYAGVEICQVCFHEVDEEGPIYGKHRPAKYLNTRGNPPGPSQIWREFQRKSET